MSQVNRRGLNANTVKTVETILTTASQADFASKDQTLIVFDWDDTLCPSHWISSSRPALQYFSPCPNDPKFKKPFAEISQIVNAILTSANELGRVIILTNAQVGWVETSCKNFMPSVLPTIQKFNCGVVYARAKFEQDLAASKRSYEYNYNANCPQRWKEEAFRGTITEFYSRYELQSWKNIVSIGDQMCEHDAARLVTKERPGLLKKRKSRVKTVKLIDCPTPEDLVAQLEVILMWLPGVCAYDGSLDIDLGEENENILEQHQRLLAP